MSEPVVVVAPATEGTTVAEESAAVAEATIEAVSDAYRQGTYAGEEAARRDETDMVSRAELDALRARIDEIDARAQAAGEVAIVAATVAAEAAEAVEEGTAEAVEEGDGPKPPEPREATAPEAGDGVPPKPSHSGYGHPGWFGARKG